MGYSNICVYLQFVFFFMVEMNGNDSVLPVDSGVGYFQNHMGTDCLMRKMMCPDLWCHVVAIQVKLATDDGGSPVINYDTVYYCYN